MSQYPTHRSQPNGYTAAECQALTLHYATATRAVLLNACPGRSWKSIKDAARRLDLSRAHPQNWTPEHLAILHAHYASGGTRVVGKLTGRSAGSIHDKAWREGLRYDGKLPEGKAHAVPPAKVQAEARARLRRAAKQAEKTAKAKVPKPPKSMRAPKSAKALLDTAKGKALPTPGVSTNAATPNLNAAKAAKATREKQQLQRQQQLAPVTATELARLPYTHPARMAYTLNARHGGAAAQAAFQTAMQQLKS